MHELVVKAYEVPTGMRNNANAVMGLFSAFGAVEHVALEADSRTAFIFFADRQGVRNCLQRIIQHEVLEDISISEKGSDGCDKADEVKKVVPLRRGYVFLGYFRVMVEGVLPSEETSAAGAHENPPSAAKRSRSPEGSTSRGSSSHSSRTSSSRSSQHDSHVDADAEQPKDSANEEKADKASPAPNKEAYKSTLALLKLVDISGNACTPSSEGHRHPVGVSPMIVFQMLRDVCLPKKIVVCKKRDGDDSRKVLVQVDRNEDVRAIVSSFNGTIVELVDCSSDAAIELAKNCSAVPKAARFRVFAMESRATGKDDLVVDVNAPGSLSITQQGIVKMGGIFDRKWAVPTVQAVGKHQPIIVDSPEQHQSPGHPATQGDVVSRPPCQPAHVTTPLMTHPSPHNPVRQMPISNAMPPSVRVGQFVQPPQVSHHNAPVNTRVSAGAEQKMVHNTIVAKEFNRGTATTAMRSEVQQGDKRSNPPATAIPPPPPLEETWEAVFSHDHQRCYYVATDAFTGEKRTTWTLPPGVSPTSLPLHHYGGAQ